jgi:hypothetical protein
MSDKFKVNWLNVILKKEFNRYLDLDTLMELGLVSKSVREKLKPFLFKDIGFSAIVFSFIFMDSNNLFLNFFSSRLFYDMNNNISKRNKARIVKKGLSDINSALSKIGTYATSFRLYKVDRAGYYLFPIISNFGNLTSLKIEECYFKFSVYSKLGELLPNLVRVQFNDVIFAKLVGDRTSNNDIIFPHGLERLVFIECNMSSTELESDTYDFLLGDNFDYSAMSDFILPKVSIPSLIELVFYVDDSESYYGIDAFLEVNPNLVSLCIVHSTSDIFKRLESLKNLELRGKIFFNSNTNLTNIESVKFLTILNNGDNSYEVIKRMCLLCPNLESLNFYFGNYDDFDDIEDIQNITNYYQLVEFFIVPIVSNLYKLKTLKIASGYSNNDSEQRLLFENILNIIGGENSLEISSDDDGYETISDSDSFEGIFGGIREGILEVEILENVDETSNQELNSPQETTDFTVFSQIEKLILEIDSDTIYSYTFEKYKYLKYLELVSTTENIDNELFKEKFDSYSDWKFSYEERKIKGYKQVSEL